MPGFAAVFQLDQSPVDRTVVERLSEVVAHRGVRSAVLTAGPIGLAYRGTESTDPQEQIATDEAARLQIVLNGCLYNRHEVLKNLGAAGMPDARIVLAAYRTWGLDCAARLDGDFAFVLHDAERRAVFCARDALGMLPLYYGCNGRRFVAGSEPKQLLAAGFSREPCEEAIAGFLTGERHLIGGPRTFFRDIYCLEPAHWVRVDGGGTRTQRYWQLDPRQAVEERTEEAMAERVRGLIVDAVEQRLPRVGPFGCALSGGLDSSSIVGLVRRALDGRGVGDPIETFSFELRDAAADEPELIKAVAAAYGTNHHSVYIDRDNVFELLPQLSVTCDQPVPNLGLLYMWRKKEAAHQQGVRVVLSGLGGDELFFGSYQHFADLLFRLRFVALWKEMRGLYPVNRTTGQRTTWRKLLMFLLLPLVPRSLKQYSRIALYGRSMGRPWIDPGLARRVGLNEKIRRGPPRIFPDAYRQACYEVFQFPLVLGTLPLHEVLGAAFGVDTRFPLLDRRLVEYMFAVPRQHKIREGRTRMLQRRAMEGLIPDVVVRQHLKKNMNPVLMRQQRGHFAAELKRLFAQRELRCMNYMDGRELHKAHGRFQAGPGGGIPSFVLWRAISLERWLESVEGVTGGIVEPAAVASEVQ